MKVPPFSVNEAEINKLPDPDAFYDALDLADVGRWSARDLDDTDALVLALVRRLRTPVKKA